MNSCNNNVRVYLKSRVPLHFGCKASGVESRNHTTAKATPSNLLPVALSEPSIDVSASRETAGERRQLTRFLRHWRIAVVSPKLSGMQRMEVGEEGLGMGRRRALARAELKSIEFVTKFVFPLQTSYMDRSGPLIRTLGRLLSFLGLDSACWTTTSLQPFSGSYFRSRRARAVAVALLTLFWSRAQ